MRSLNYEKKNHFEILPETQTKTVFNKKLETLFLENVIRYFILVETITSLNCSYELSTQECDDEARTQTKRVQNRIEYGQNHHPNKKFNTNFYHSDFGGRIITLNCNKTDEIPQTDEITRKRTNRYNIHLSMQ